MVDYVGTDCKKAVHISGGIIDVTGNKKVAKPSASMTGAVGSHLTYQREVAHPDGPRARPVSLDWDALSKILAAEARPSEEKSPAKPASTPILDERQQPRP